MAAPPAGHSYVLPGKTEYNFTDNVRVNVNDPQLISLVNKLQDVFATVGVRSHKPDKHDAQLTAPGTKPHRFTTDCGCWIAI